MLAQATALLLTTRKLPILTRPANNEIGPTLADGHQPSRPGGQPVTPLPTTSRASSSHPHRSAPSRRHAPSGDRPDTSCPVGVALYSAPAARSLIRRSAASVGTSASPRSFLSSERYQLIERSDVAAAG